MYMLDVSLVAFMSTICSLCVMYAELLTAKNLHTHSTGPQTLRVSFCIKTKLYTCTYMYIYICIYIYIYMLLCGDNIMYTHTDIQISVCMCKSQMCHTCTHVSVYMYVPVYYSIST